MIGISFDVDWAPDEVIEDTLALLDEAGVRATLFATHPTPVLQRPLAHEVGIHPNFLPVTTAEAAATLDRLMAAYPDAAGVRCHSYHQSSPILEMFVQRGLRYDSNLVMLGCRGLRPFRHWNGMTRLPVFWEDDVNCIVGGSWEPAELDLDEPDSLFIFDFHPVHVFLNTESLARYEAARPHYHDPGELRRHANPETSGIGTRVFLRRLLEQVDASDVLPLREIAERLPCQNETTVRCRAAAT
jgi:hypothetical protein